jgi:acyl dehydratase
MTTTFATADDMLASVGRSLDATAWIPVAQDRVDAFAGATDDRQWIHVDPERAASGPFGGTIAHGYLTLSLLAPFLAEMISVPMAELVINYGLDRVRFLQPVRSGSRVRATGTVTDAVRTDRGIRVSTSVTVEIEGESKPALVAETISLFVVA